MNLIFNIKKAFSIAEMMIVMLILSIVLAAALPAITRRAAATKVKDDSIPAGTIAIWSGNIASIPAGWHLCDGTNGTPDLRSRFVYGAGGSDATASKVLVSGWGKPVSQHWPAGAVGGEEMHTLVESVTGTGITITQQKIFLPRFICLAYIMKIPSSNTLTNISIPSP